MSAVIDPRAPESDDASLRLETSRLRLQRRLQAGRAASNSAAGSGAFKTVLRVAESAGNESLRPIAQSNPLALVGVAAASGALLMWIKPWRSLAGSALLAGMLPQLGSRLVSQIPIASLLDAVTHLASKRSD
jgi:hypothetical protein